MRFFNTAGPVNRADHYCLPPLGRVNLDEILSLIANTFANMGGESNVN